MLVLVLVLQKDFLGAQKPSKRDVTLTEDKNKRRQNVKVQGEEDPFLGIKHIFTFQVYNMNNNRQLSL